jgi:hypothetical protein
VTFPITFNQMLYNAYGNFAHCSWITTLNWDMTVSKYCDTANCSKHVKVIYIYLLFPMSWLRFRHMRLWNTIQYLLWSDKTRNDIYRNKHIVLRFKMNVTRTKYGPAGLKLAAQNAWCWNIDFVHYLTFKLF